MAACAASVAVDAICTYRRVSCPRVRRILLRLSSPPVRRAANRRWFTSVFTGFGATARELALRGFPSSFDSQGVLLYTQNECCVSSLREESCWEKETAYRATVCTHRMLAVRGTVEFLALSTSAVRDSRAAPWVHASLASADQHVAQVRARNERL